MHRLRWDPQDFLECLGVEPVYSEDDGALSYTVTKHGLTLLLTLWELQSVVQLSLFQVGEAEPFLTQAILVYGAIELRKEKWGEFLRMTDCLVVGEFHCLDPDDLHPPAKVSWDLTLEIRVNPRIYVGFV